MHFNYPKNNIYTYPASRSNQTTEEYYNNEIVVISTEWKGKNDFSFCATVLKSNGIEDIRLVNIVILGIKKTFI